jgi:hypothetical protein
VTLTLHKPEEHILRVDEATFWGHVYNEVYICSCGEWKTAPSAFKTGPPSKEQVLRWHSSHANAVVITI